VHEQTTHGQHRATTTRGTQAAGKPAPAKTLEAERGSTPAGGNSRRHKAPKKPDARETPSKKTQTWGTRAERVTRAGAITTRTKLCPGQGKLAQTLYGERKGGYICTVQRISSSPSAQQRYIAVAIDAPVCTDSKTPRAATAQERMSSAATRAKMRSTQ
jgi:hypothetical protein